MRSAIVGSLVTFFAAGCIGLGINPPTVQPTLAAIETLGLHCGEGKRDNVPSGLFQWHCLGAIESSPSTVLVEGNAEGVAGITLVVADPKDPAGARRRFGLLVDAVPPLRTAPILKDTVAGWTGGQEAWTVGDVRISALCDETQCIVAVTPALDPLRPLLLP